MLFKHSIDSVTEVKKLSDISNKQLLELCYVMSKNMVDGNVQFNEQLTLNEVLDGIECCFGVNENEDLFLEVEDYDEKSAAEEILKKNPTIIQTMSELYSNYGPVKIDCTMFPTFSHVGDDKGNVTYSTLPYDRRKFGQQGAFIVKEVKTWSPKTKDYVNAVESVRRSVMGRLQEADNDKWRVYNETNTKLDFQMPFAIQELQDIINDDSRYSSALKVLDNPPGDHHRNILERVLTSLKPKLEKSIHHHLSRVGSVFGKVNEKSHIRGGVLSVNSPNGNYKIQIDNSDFDRLKTRKYMTRENLKSLEDLSEMKFFNDVFGFDANNSKDFTEAVTRVANHFKSNKTGEERINKFLSLVIDVMKKEGYELVEDEVREKSINNILATQNDIAQIRNQVAEEETDPDTKRKINSSLDKFEKKLNFIKKHINIKSYTGQSYVLYLLKLVLAPKMESLMSRVSESINESGEVISNAVPSNRVLLMVSTAQPWTMTDDQMIFESKQRLREFNASKVVILINGHGYEEQVPTETVVGERFNLQRDNPLSIKRRIDLVSSIYEDDIEVEVCQRGLKEGGPNDILDEVFMKDNNMVVGIISPKNEAQVVGKRWQDFNESNWKETRCNEMPIPFENNINGLGVVGVQDIGISQSKARKIVKESDLELWVEMVAPPGISDKALKKYIETYETLHQHFTNLDEEEYRAKMKNVFWSDK